jgi:beta-N-acetylhexosaminidase
VTDDLAMKALAGEPADLAVRALAAGCDIALYCSGEYAPTEALSRVARPCRIRQVSAWPDRGSKAERGRLGLDAEALARERDRSTT